MKEMEQMDNNNLPTQTRKITKNRGKFRLFAMALTLMVLAGIAAFALGTASPNSAQAQTSTATPTPAASGTPTTGTNPGNSKGPGGQRGGPNGNTGTPPTNGQAGGRGGHGPGDKQGGPRGAATLVSVSGNTLNLTKADGTTSTATVDANTTYQKAGKQITLADLKAGDKLAIHTAQGATTASRVEVVLNHIDGTLSAVDGSNLTVTNKDGATTKVVVNTQTTYERLGQTAALADLKTGATIRVEGTLGTDNVITALKVNINVPGLGGSVTKVDGATLTVTDRGGTKTIITDASTRFLKAGQAATIADITAGSKIRANGVLNADGSLKAEQVVIELPKEHGAVSKVDGATITLTDPRGNKTETIVTNSSTQFFLVSGPGATPTKAALSDVVAGKFIEAEGTLDSATSTLTAQVVNIVPAQSGHGK